MEELRPDPAVHAHAARHVLDVGADPLAESAISLMKVILVARKAFAAYLVSSAVSSPVNRIGVSFSDSGR